ncbi:hypothetical protein [Dactylosporangium salmoneum]|uniref:hypothetical protein n=1 Tax=Dactylosporangium salmoneum TaxID=53361 RepID=UPI0031DD215B
MDLLEHADEETSLTGLSIVEASILRDLLDEALGTVAREACPACAQCVPGPALADDRLRSLRVWLRNTSAMTDTPPSVPYVPGSTGAMPAQGFPPMAPPMGRPPVPGPNPGGKGGGRAVIFGVIGLVVGLAIGGCIGAAAASGTNNSPASSVDAAKPAATTVYVTVTAAAPTTAPAPTTAAAPTPAATTAAAPPPAAPTIDDGTWTVGEDFPAGTYKTTGAGDSCYWAIYKSGTNQSFDSMVDNHLGGGNLRVTVKAGQDFETKRCGVWSKVG